MVNFVMADFDLRSKKGSSDDRSCPDAPGQPIFLLGFARSGTTWVNGVLRDFLDVGLVNEGRFIIPFAKKFGPGETIDNIDRFIDKLSEDDFFKLLAKVYGISLDWSEILRNKSSQDYAELVKLILTEIGKQQNKQLIGSKDPAFGWNMDILLSHFPSSRLIHVIRDGRDCALSHYELVWGLQNAYVVASKWRNYIQTVRDSVRHHSANYMEVCYEDLLANPARQFMRMESFIYGDFSATPRSSLGVDAFTASVEDDAYEHRTGKWQKQMSAHDKAIFGSVAGDTLANLGYSVVPVLGKVSPWSRGWYIASNRVQKEYWHVARRLSKRIDERKPGYHVTR